MKIVDRKAFLALPSGTLFSKYVPSCMEDLMIKGDTWLPNDFLHQQVTCAIECTGSGDFGDRLDRSQFLGESLPMDFDSMGRDGCFDAEQLFAVWERADVVGLMNRLGRALKDGYPEV